MVAAPLPQAHPLVAPHRHAPNAASAEKNPSVTSAMNVKAAAVAVDEVNAVSAAKVVAAVRARKTHKTVTNRAMHRPHATKVQQSRPNKTVAAVAAAKDVVVSAPTKPKAA